MYYLTVINSIILGIVFVALIKQNSIEKTLSEVVEELNDIHKSFKNEYSKTKKYNEVYKTPPIPRGNFDKMLIMLVDSHDELVRQNISLKQEIVKLQEELEALKNSKS